eukprot:GHVT01017463.1.p1 GENE.GHVT01017463.1~~GHVT01017463.1.p1  ORF type:complete len:159 (+),score=21.37 GHVT01017463.1:383-859(+)
MGNVSKEYPLRKIRKDMRSAKQKGNIPLTPPSPFPTPPGQSEGKPAPSPFPPKWPNIQWKEERKKKSNQQRSHFAHELHPSSPQPRYRVQTVAHSSGPNEQPNAKQQNTPKQFFDRLKITKAARQKKAVVKSQNSSTSDWKNEISDAGCCIDASRPGD